MKHAVIFQPSGRRTMVDGGATIMEAARSVGVVIESICGEQATCGKCKVMIQQGFFELYGIESKAESLSPIGEGERGFLSPEQLGEGYRLACQARIFGDVLIFVPEESRTGKQVVRKDVVARVMQVKPAVKRYYVELAPASLHDPLGDFERLQGELSQRYELNDLTIDYRVLLDLQKAIRQGNWTVSVSIWQDKEIISIEPGSVERLYGLAVDIGTTTVVGHR